MDNWQQTFLREDPWGEIPFDNGAWLGFTIETWVGIACIACVALVVAFGK